MLFTRSAARVRTPSSFHRKYVYLRSHCQLNAEYSMLLTTSCTSCVDTWMMVNAMRRYILFRSRIASLFFSSSSLSLLYISISSECVLHALARGLYTLFFVFFCSYSFLLCTQHEHILDIVLFSISFFSMIEFHSVRVCVCVCCVCILYITI